MPVDTVNRVVPQLITKGAYARPVLGIQADQQLNQILQKQLGVQGVAVAGVEPGSPAAQAGLRAAKIERGGGIVPGDIILAVDGDKVSTLAELVGRLDRKKVGQTVTLRLLREGRETEVKATLQQAST